MKPKFIFQVTLALILLAGLVWNAPPAYALGIIVNSLADTRAPDGQCTLREAIINADTDTQVGSVDCAPGLGSDTINFGVGGPIILGAPLPAITSPSGLTIDGGGSIVVDGIGSWQIFNVMPGANLTLQNLFVINGSAPLTGGGVQNSGTLTVITCIFIHNIAPQGGGIYNANVPGAFLTVINSDFNDNQAPVSGGGIYNAATMNVIGSSFRANMGGDGAGIFNISEGLTAVPSLQTWPGRLDRQTWGAGSTTRVSCP
jgi:CSLREA domain-containing protein